MGHLYDTGTSTSGTGNRIGNYDLMAYGNFGLDNIRHYPNSLSAYHKLFTGWVSYEDIIADGWYTLGSRIHQVYKITHGFHSVEYLLLGNRQPIGYNSTMTGAGIVIYHVDEQVKKQKFCGWPGLPGFPENADAGGTAGATAVRRRRCRRRMTVVYALLFLFSVLAFASTPRHPPVSGS